MKIYRPLRKLYLGYYYGTYEGKGGKKYIFESEDYLKAGSEVFVNKNKNKKTQILLYVDPNNESNYCYKISDFN